MSSLTEVNSHLLFHDKGGKYSYYIKLFADGNLYRDPVKEYNGYKKLSGFLTMPKARITTTSTYGDCLVVTDTKMDSCSNILTTNPELANDTLSRFLLDVGSMWEQTVQDSGYTNLTRNWQAESLNTLELISGSDVIQRIGKLPMRINGLDYPSLSETVDICKENLNSKKEKKIVMCHGDEHLGNILVRDGGYWAIDPGNYSGYNFVSSTINNLVGGTTLFDYKYTGQYAAQNDVFNVDYELQDDYKQAAQLLNPTFNKFANKGKDLVDGEMIAKELLFVNGVRTALGMTKRNMDINYVLQTGLLYLGVAVDQFYSENIT